jgi:RND superfamily putative drug exporter
VILFGLSMDHHVFIISRIRELFDRGANMDDAVRQVITSTAGVVTGAAVVMVGVFAAVARMASAPRAHGGVARPASAASAAPSS